MAVGMNQDDRISATLRCMADNGVDLLIACSNGLHMPDRPDPVVHLSGYRALGESFVLLRRDGALSLIVSPAADAERAACWKGPGACVATDDLAAALAKDSAWNGANTGRVALVGVDAIPHRLAERLLAIRKDEIVAFDDSFYRACGRKTAKEIKGARRAASIAEQGFQRLLKLAGPGMRECDLAVELKCYMESLGADDNFLMLCASPHNPAVMPSSNRIIERGDILITELTPSYEGQFVQICRTVSIGPPSAVLQEKYDLVVRAMWAGIDAVRPGIPMSQVCAAIDRVLEAAGYAEYCRPPHMRRRGHGLGCGSAAPGDVATSNETILEEDMIFVLHPNQYLPETGYLMCGEPVRVTATRAETLSTKTAALASIE
jgi:Xaa-Pro dipeptidase